MGREPRVMHLRCQCIECEENLGRSRTLFELGTNHRLDKLVLLYKCAKEYVAHIGDEYSEAGYRRPGTVC